MCAGLALLFYNCPYHGKINKGVVEIKERGNAANGRRDCECFRGREAAPRAVMGMNEKWTEATCLLLPFTVLARAESQACEFL